MKMPTFLHQTRTSCCACLCVYILCMLEDPFNSRVCLDTNNQNSIRTIEKKNIYMYYLCIICIYSKERGQGAYCRLAPIYTHTAVIQEGHRYIFYTCCAAAREREKSSPEIKLLSAILFGNRPRTLRDHTAQIVFISVLN